MEVFRRVKGGFGLVLWGLLLVCWWGFWWVLELVLGFFRVRFVTEAEVVFRQGSGGVLVVFRGGVVTFFLGGFRAENGDVGGWFWGSFLGGEMRLFEWRFQVGFRSICCCVLGVL